MENFDRSAKIPSFYPCLKILLEVETLMGTGQI